MARRHPVQSEWPVHMTRGTIATYGTATATVKGSLGARAGPDHPPRKRDPIAGGVLPTRTVPAIVPVLNVAAEGRRGWMRQASVRVTMERRRKSKKPLPWRRRRFKRGRIPGTFSRTSWLLSAVSLRIEVA